MKFRLAVLSAVAWSASAWAGEVLMPDVSDGVWRPTVRHAIGGEDIAYSPPLVANGDIAFRVGPFGDNSTLWCAKAWTPPVFREGRRHGSERGYALVSFGNYRLDATVDGLPLAGAAFWEQTLDLFCGGAFEGQTLMVGFRWWEGFRGSDPNGGVQVVGLCEEGAIGR